MGQVFFFCFGLFLASFTLAAAVVVSRELKEIGEGRRKAIADIVLLCTEELALVGFFLLGLIYMYGALTGHLTEIRC